jgi:biopolymer transport protein ExbB
MSSPHRKYPNASHVASSVTCACAIAVLTLLTSAALAQEQHPPVEGLAVLPRDLSPWGMFMNADVVVKVVMIGLVIASIVTWTVCLAKTIELLKARRQARAALAALNSIQTLRTVKPSNLKEPAASFCAAAIAELRLTDGIKNKDGLKERVASRLERFEAAFSRRINRGTGVLATIGATAPFVGLFGTVWGIMSSFQAIAASKNTSLAVVAPGIAEALFATALGLLAAIPAVIFYNMFAADSSRLAQRLEAFADEFSAIVSRQIDVRT